MLFVSQRQFQVIGILMFSATFSRRIASRLLVRAFTTTSNNGMATRRIAVGSQFPQQRWSSSHGVARVEEDLDTALDELLGDAFIEAEEPRNLENEAQPVPKTVVEEVSGRG
jgi:hypothetical protein